MARNKSYFTIQIEYYSVRGLWAFLRALPETWAYNFCQTFLKTLLCFLPKRRKIITENLLFCFPDVSPAQRKHIARLSIENAARGVSYIPRLEKWVRDEKNRRIQAEGFEHLDKALKEGKGAMIFTGHFGFWEAIPVYIQQASYVLAMAARPLDNPRINHLINSVRCCEGARLFTQHELIRQGLRWLRANHTLGILIDQNLYKGGVFVDFFGRPAATTHVISLLARRTGSPVLPIRGEWTGDTLKIIVDPPLTLSQNPDPEQAMGEDTQMMTKVVEDMIRKNPEQWFWLHNRWKRRPEPGDWVHASKAG